MVNKLGSKMSHSKIWSCLVLLSLHVEDGMKDLRVYFYFYFIFLGLHTQQQ